MLYIFAVIVADPAKLNMKCGPDGSPLRVFTLRGQDATVARCFDECMDNDQCVAFSARWNNFAVEDRWCIGCKVELNVPTVNPGDKGAIAYKKLGKTLLLIF